jgi:DNA polymerase-3 subunit delta'
MNLDRIAGHARVRAHLLAAVEDESRLSHAYLFTGPARVGKTATALAFGHDLLEAAGAPATPGGMHPDLWVEDGDAESISIDVIRREARGGRSGSATDEPSPGSATQPLQVFLGLKGMRSNRRVAILARAERLKEVAASPLLKTIEEPPPGTVLVLCTQAADLLPATIRSRCQEVVFARLGDQEVADFLRGRDLEPDPDTLRLARGCPGEAVRLAAEPAERQRRLAWGDALAGIPGGSWLDIVAVGGRFGTPDSAKNRVLAREALDAWEWWLRDAAATRAGEASTATDGVLAQLELGGLLDLWESAREAADRVENNVNPRMAIEVFLADVARAGSGAVPTRRTVSRGTLSRVLAASHG